MSWVFFRGFIVFFRGYLFYYGIFMFNLDVFRILDGNLVVWFILIDYGDGILLVNNCGGLIFFFRIFCKIIFYLIFSYFFRD